MLALTHLPSPHLSRAVRTFAREEAIDLQQARQQHSAYCRLLESLGVRVRVLDCSPDLADSVFIEDTAVVLDEVAILASMGAASRAAEPAAIESVLSEYRAIEQIVPPAQLEGGDVLRIAADGKRTLLVGLSCRTNASGMEAFDAAIKKYGYETLAISVRGCLHLKTGCTALPDGRLLVNPQWIDVAHLGRPWIAVPAEEPWGANLLLVGEHVCLPQAHLQTADLVARLGYDVRTAQLSEFAKAEGGITCLSLLLDG